MSIDTHDEAVTAAQAPVAIVRVDGHYRVLATRRLAEGETIFTLEGIRVETPTRYSFQIGAADHLSVPLGETLEETMDRRPWRFLNHSCEPNAWVSGLRLLATRNIEPWEQITTDYNCTEMRLASPFTCRCGAPECIGVVRGFSVLGATERLRRARFLAAHLRESARDA